MTKDMALPKISSLLVICNEEKRLRECLSAIKFCDEIVVVDLASTDQSVEIAEEYANKIIQYEQRIVLEKLHELFVPKLKNDLVLLIDPDEILDKNLSAKALKCLEENPDVAIIRIPWRFFFKDKILKYTVWGGEKFKNLIINREKVSLYSRVHRGIVLKNPRDRVITISGTDFIRHYWADSYTQLFEKHRRYLKLEGQSRYDSGQRYSFLKKVNEAGRSLVKELMLKKGFLGGGREIFLIFFYSWYIWQANNSLKDYERRQK
jgi:glycosyltransferase involved in cell wall biosynthesis